MVRKKALMAIFFHNINDADMLTEILSYLSLEEVTRLKSVCKSWNRLISDPHFQSLQLQRSSSTYNSRHALSFFHNSAWKPGPNSLAFHPDQPPIVPVQSPFSFLTNYTSLFVLAVSNGLVLLSDPKRDFFHVCNPSTGTLIKTIPSPPSSYANCASAHYGLATWSLSGSFNIVFIVTCSMTPTAFVSVYSSTTDWFTICPFKRRLKHSTISYDFSAYNPRRRIQVRHVRPPWMLSSALNPVGAAFAKGCVHWLTDGGLIIAFAVNTQVVRVMDLPDGVSIKRRGGRYHKRYHNVWFGSADNRLCLVFVPGPEREGNLLQLWILEDYDNVNWKLVLEITDSTVVSGAPVYFDGRRIGIAALGEWKERESKRPIRFFDTHTRKWGGSYNLLPQDSQVCERVFELPTIIAYV